MPTGKIFNFANAIKVLILAVVLGLWYALVRFVLSKAALVNDSTFYPGAVVITILYIYFLRSVSDKPISRREYTVHLYGSGILFIIGYLLCYTALNVMAGMLLMIAGVIHFFWVSSDNPKGKFNRNAGFSAMLYIFGISLCFKGLWAFVGIVAAVLGYLGVKRTYRDFEKDNGKLYKIVTGFMLVFLIILPMLGIFSTGF